MAKKDEKDFGNCTKCWICDNVYVDGGVKRRDHCRTTGKYKGSAHRNCNINVKLNYKIPIVFNNLKNYGLHLIMQEPDKFNFKVNVMPNGLEKYMNFNINKKLIFIDSFQFLSSSLDGLVKNLGKNGFQYLSQEFDSKVLDLVKQKGFYHYEYMSGFEKFKDKLSSKEKFYSSLTGKNISDKKHEHVIKVWNTFQEKKMRDYYNFYLKCDVLLLANVFEKFRKNSSQNYRPALSWDAMLNMAKVELELILDANIK